MCLSADIERRIQQHNAGESRWTKERGPWTIVWQSDELTLSEARKLEKRLKRQKGGQGLFDLKAHNPASEAGSLVQIQPSQPIFLIAVTYRVHVLENRS